MSARGALRVALAVVVLATSVGAPTAAARLHVDHEVDLRPLPSASILVQGDAGFTPLNGVRSGQGTASDPYVISDLVIVHSQGYGIRLLETRAHAVVENITVIGREGEVGNTIECLVADPLGDCDAFQGIDIQDSQNVTVRRVRILSEAYGIRTLRAQNVLIEDSYVGDRRTDMSLGGIGVLVRASRDVVVRNVDIARIGFPVWITDFSSRITVENSTLEGVSGSTIPVANTAGAVLRGNAIRNAQVVVSRVVSDLALVGNDLRGGPVGFNVVDIPTTRIAGLDVCGNRFEGFTSLVGAMKVRRASGIAIMGNAFVNNARGIDAQLLPDFRFERNLVSGSTEYGAFINVNGLEAHQNSFVGNGIAMDVGPRGGNVSENWWGDASGPSGAEPTGRGDRLDVANPDATTWRPWLLAAPDLSTACELSAVGAIVSPHAWAPALEGNVGAHVDERIGDVRVRASAGAPFDVRLGRIETGL